MQEEELEKEIISNTKVLKTCDWVREEFASGDFEDKRLFLRLLVIANDLSNNPPAPINQASGAWKFAKAAYRFFDNDKITAEGILKSHIKKTHKRITDHSETVLAIQDTTFLNYSHMTCSKDLGPIGKNAPSSMGLVMHTVFATTGQGLPLGFLHQDIWARDKQSTGRPDLKPIEEKESNKWLRALSVQSKLLGKNQNIIAVCDREADIYALFDLANQLETKLLVRASHDRCLEDGAKLWSSFNKMPTEFSYSLQMPDSKKDIATIDVKYSNVKFALSSHKKNINGSPKHIRNITAIYLKETSPPDHREPVSWMLLTNFPIKSHKRALEVIGWYTQRWNIEVLHRIMKSGCNIELTRLETNKRRIPFVALKSIIAWRLMLITHYNKISPNSPATSILSHSECNALYIITHNSIAPAKPFSSRKAITWLAQLGGYLARKADPLPGPTHVWRGWHRLQDFTKMHSLYASG